MCEGGPFLSSVSAPHVLVIDDSADHLRLFSRILTKAGYRCSTALVGSRSVDLTTAGHVDVVTLDYRLQSTLRAVDVANLVREFHPEAPIIVLSELEWMPDDMKPFAFAFVRKGEPEELLHTLEEALAHGKGAPIAIAC